MRWSDLGFQARSEPGSFLEGFRNDHFKYSPNRKPVSREGFWDLLGFRAEDLAVSRRLRFRRFRVRGLKGFGSLAVEVPSCSPGGDTVDDINP